MYTIKQNGITIGTSESIVFIFYGENGAYQECPEHDAQGFCVKIPTTYTAENGTEITELSDTVFCLPEHTLRGDERFAEYDFSE